MFRYGLILVETGRFLCDNLTLTHTCTRARTHTRTQFYQVSIVVGGGYHQSLINNFILWYFFRLYQADNYVNDERSWLRSCLI